MYAVMVCGYSCMICSFALFFGRDRLRTRNCCARRCATASSQSDCSTVRRQSARPSSLTDTFPLLSRSLKRVRYLRSKMHLRPARHNVLSVTVPSAFDVVNFTVVFCFQHTFVKLLVFIACLRPTLENYWLKASATSYWFLWATD